MWACILTARMPVLVNEYPEQGSSDFWTLLRLEFPLPRFIFTLSLEAFLVTSRTVLGDLCGSLDRYTGGGLPSVFVTCCMALVLVLFSDR